jgi:hypothetical protein
MKLIAILIMIGSFGCAISLIVHLFTLILEGITKKKDGYKWLYFTYNITWMIGFPCFIIALILVWCGYGSPNIQIN